MFDIERWQEIFEAIAKNKLRTFLTGISVGSGIFILVILLGVGKGLENGIARQFAKNAENRIYVWPGITSKEYEGFNPGRRLQFKNDDYEFTLKYFGPEVDLKSPSYREWTSNTVYKNETANYRIEGVYPDMQFLENASIVEGRFINFNDIKYKEKIAVIGHKVMKDLFSEGKSVVGEEIIINKSNYKVVGVFSDPGGERDEARIFLPLTTMQQVFNLGQNIRNLSYTLAGKESFEEALGHSEKFTATLERKLKERHKVAPDDLNAIGISNTLEAAKKFFDLNTMIKLFFWGVGVCTIIAGIVGVGNIMLIIVKERTKEIGIRKALGATPFSIVTMIMQESIFVTTISGFTGLIFGLLILEMTGPQIESDFFYYPQVDFNIALSTVFLLVIAGALAGFFPSYRAARIKPIDALKDV